jgi:uncharacterized protein YbaR (Trm112 family)
VLPPELVATFVCPKSKQPLIYFPRGEDDRDEAQAFLLCPSSGLRYPVEDGLPVLLVEEATVLNADEVARLVERAKVLGIAR